MTDTITEQSRAVLVELILHGAFYPVLMLDRNGANRPTIEHLHEATRAKIDRFRRCASVEDVIATFQRELDLTPADEAHALLRSLELPVLGDVRAAFERKAHELGFEFAPVPPARGPAGR